MKIREFNGKRLWELEREYVRMVLYDGTEVIGTVDFWEDGDDNNLDEDSVDIIDFKEERQTYTEPEIKSIEILPKPKNKNKSS